ncbi:hypothetical protein MSG28_000708 [Choristoneura fumiferana]|uniref:Uncharacterized protein n=1 Tax=Choristoneura fumiferana TaxID=7141 RepID=A0ACC0K207_CHOFU|nr:hypothetical protein MSG28_000708 [Choristoneura fumiferana]
MLYEPDIAYENDPFVSIGKMSCKCQWCNALKWKDETPGVCCSSGKVQLEALCKPSEPLYSLLLDLHPDHKHFIANIRKYNSAFQMTSFGGKSVSEDGYMPTFKVQGQVYHLIGSLLPEQGQKAKFLQIYFVGEDEREASLRCSVCPNQYLVDEYAKIERLNFIRNNQKKLRADSYVHLMDAIGRQDVDVNQLGQMVVLPSSFIGSPKYMHARTQDAMTYVRYYGRPHLFITFTCNPRWQVIAQQLFPGQKPQDRYDIIARVFRLKVKKLIDLLVKGKIFGVVRCYMYSVEWQKRGLPHVHILLWLTNHIASDSIDNIIWAEIPDPESDPKLYEIVKSNMIHGPCGDINIKSPCMKNNACSKRYPRPLVAETQTGDDGYPQYRRRSPEQGGFTVNIKGVELDNRWVVPFNPVLSRIFNAHLNVEYCNSVKSIKYVCKYVNKGSDQATIALEDGKDEVKSYESGRYISSSEAVWRILSFPIHERFPTCT